MLTAFHYHGTPETPVNLYQTTKKNIILILVAVTAWNLKHLNIILPSRISINSSYFKWDDQLWAILHMYRVGRSYRQQRYKNYSSAQKYWMKAENETAPVQSRCQTEESSDVFLRCPRMLSVRQEISLRMATTGLPWATQQQTREDCFLVLEVLRQILVTVPTLQTYFACLCKRGD